MNPYTAQVIGGNIGQFLQSRGKDARRERMLRLIQMDNEQKKLASFLEEQKRQQAARDAAAKAAQDKIAEQTKIRNAQEQMRLYGMTGLSVPIEELLPSDETRMPDSLEGYWRGIGEAKEPTIPADIGSYFKGIGEAGEAANAAGRPITEMSQAPGAGELRKKIGPEQAEFYRGMLQNAVPDDIDQIMKDIGTKAFKEPPKDKTDEFMAKMLTPNVEQDINIQGGKFVNFPIENYTYDLAKTLAKKYDVELTPQMFEEMKTLAQIKQDAGVSPPVSGGQGGRTVSPQPEQNLTGDEQAAAAEWDKYVDTLRTAKGGPPPLPPGMTPPNSWIPKGWMAPSTAQPFSKAWYDARDSYVNSLWKAGSPGRTNTSTKSEAAQTAASFILEGIGDRERINRYTQLKGDPEKWAALPTETQAAIEAKVSVLRNREAQKANKPKGGAEKPMTEKEYWYNKRQLTKRQQAMSNRTKDASGQWVVEWENTYIPQADFVAESQSIRKKIEEYEAKKSGKPAPKKDAPKMRPVDPSGMAQDDLKVLP